MGLLPAHHELKQCLTETGSQDAFRAKETFFSNAETKCAACSSSSRGRCALAWTGNPLPFRRAILVRERFWVCRQRSPTHPIA